MHGTLGGILGQRQDMKDKLRRSERSSVSVLVSSLWPLHPTMVRCKQAGRLHEGMQEQPMLTLQQSVNP